uniref:Uncharacterized protein n=1 Tax=Phaeomonas parva TaxID=124430 RepID=A0A7S1U9X6_9STRA|mmetsp:Transcript_38360/g.120267  ORF Transcript_38360/g.120267 Transcript_38360/m.120267 type:complete len:294 (+) Transcript_38360:251-1132(+)
MAKVTAYRDPGRFRFALIFQYFGGPMLYEDVKYSYMQSMEDTKEGDNTVKSEEDVRSAVDVVDHKPCVAATEAPDILVRRVGGPRAYILKLRQASRLHRKAMCATFVVFLVPIIFLALFASTFAENSSESCTKQECLEPRGWCTDETDTTDCCQEYCCEADEMPTPNSGNPACTAIAYTSQCFHGDRCESYDPQRFFESIGSIEASDITEGDGARFGYIYLILAAFMFVVAAMVSRYIRKVYHRRLLETFRMWSKIGVHMHFEERSENVDEKIESQYRKRPKLWFAVDESQSI